MKVPQTKSGTAIKAATNLSSWLYGPEVQRQHKLQKNCPLAGCCTNRGKKLNERSGDR